MAFADVRPDVTPTGRHRAGVLATRRGRWGVASAVFLVLVLTWGVGSVRANGGLTFVYDDPYIHLSIADTLAHHGTWGVTPGHYESGSSSPGWVLLLASGIRLGLPGVWVASALAVLSGLWVLWAVAGLTVFDRTDTAPATTAVLLLAPLSLSLVPLVAMGMEHILHVAIVVQLIVRFGHLVGATGVPTTRARLPLPLLFVAAGAIRFESVAVAVGIAAAYVIWRAPQTGPSLRRRVAQGTSWLVATCIPIALVAVVNVAYGQYPLPDSVMAKAFLEPDPDRTVLRPIVRLATDPRLGAMVLLGVAALILARKVVRDASMAPLVAAIAGAAVFLTAGPVTMTWLGRYQVFAIDALALGLLAVAGSRPPHLSRSVTVAILLALALFPTPIELKAQQAVIEGSGEIHRHHELAAEFLNRYYADRTVALNDVGVIGFEYRGDIIDLLGLVSHDVVEARLAGRFDREWVTARLAERQTTLAIGYDSWIGPILPRDWRRVGSWCLDHEPSAAGDRCQQFYAAPTEAATLRGHLQAFAPLLPDGVSLTLP